MKLRTIKRLAAALLCVAMLAGIPALAASEDDALPSAPVGSETEAVVELPEVCEELPSTGESFGVQAQSMSAAVFNVTVPTNLPIHMDANGGITCGNIVITNNGTEPVEVKDTQITALNGWTLVDYATASFTKANEGQHKVALQLGPWDSAIAANGGQKTIDVAAKIPYQGVRMTNASIAQVVFVLGVPVPDASIDWEYTTDDTTNTITLTKYIGESNDVVVHDKYYVGGKTYKTALDVSAYYRYGPFNISDKQYYITSISFDGGIILPADMKEVFNNCSALTNVDGLDGWDTSDVTNMSGMFYYCTSLTNIDGISGWDTSNVTTMGSMFSGCRSLISLDIRAFNTSKVTDMSYMFSGCSSLVYLDLTGWDLSALSEKSKMFSGCTNLTSVYVKDQATKDKLDSGTDKPSTCAIIVAGIEITGNTSVNVGETIQLSVTKNLPPSVAENAVTWSTSNSNIATVNGSGLVTGVSAGTATITASCNGVTATHTVSVESQIPADFDEACDILFLVTGYNTDGTVSYEKTWCAYGMDYSGNRGGCGKYDSTLSDVVSESGTIRIKALKAPSYLWFPSGWSFLTSYGSSCYKISEYGEGDWTNVTLKNSEGAFSGYVSFKASGGTTQP